MHYIFFSDVVYYNLHVHGYHLCLLESLLEYSGWGFPNLPRFLLRLVITK